MLVAYSVTEIIVLFLFVRQFFINKSRPKTDVYLPDFLFWFGFIMALGTGVGGYFALSGSDWISFGVLIAVEIVGLCAMLCNMNQRIRYESPNTFTYTTFLGRSASYEFRDITRVRQNADSFTIFVGKKKLHIESMARGGGRFVYDAEKYGHRPRYEETYTKPGIRKSIGMISGGTGLFILNLIVPVLFVGIGVLLMFVVKSPDMDISSLRTAEVVYAGIEGSCEDGYTITCADGSQYIISNICAKAFNNYAFSDVQYGERLYLDYEEGDIQESTGLQYIYSLRTEDMVYLSVDSALDELKKNADLGKFIVPVMIAIGAIYLFVFLYAMSDAEKHYKLLKLFIKPGYINIPRKQSLHHKKRRPNRK